MAKKSFDEIWNQSDSKKKSFDEIWGTPVQTQEEALREIRETSPFYYANNKPTTAPLQNTPQVGTKDFDLGYVGEKAWKGAVGTVGGLLNAGANILDNPVQSLDSVVRFIPDDAAKKIDQNFLDPLANAGKNIAQNLIDYSQTSAYDPSKMTGFERFLGDAAGAIGGMAPSIATGALAGPTAGLAVMGTSVFGNSLDQALDEGAEFDNAVLYGIASAGVELATEKLMGGMPFLGKGLLDDVTKEWLGSKLASGTGKAVLNYVKEAVGEGAEEYIAEVAGEFLTDIYSDAKDEEEIVDRLLKVQPDAFYSFLLGSATGGVMGAPGLVSDVRNSKTKPLSTETKPVETDPMKAMINENAKAEAQKIVEKPSETEFDSNFLEKGLKSDNVAVKMEAQRLNEKKIRKLYENRTSTEKQINDIVKTMNSLGVPASVLEDYIEFDALGAASSKGIELSKKADKGITRVAVHEIKHLASTSGINNQLSQVLRSLAEMDGIDLDKSRENIVKEYAKREKALDNAAIEEELDAYIAQEYLFTEHGIKGLVRSNLSLAEKVMQMIRNIRIRISGTEFEKQLLKAEQLYTEAINEVSKKQSYKEGTEHPMHAIKITTDGKEVVVPDRINLSKIVDIEKSSSTLDVESMLEDASSIEELSNNTIPDSSENNNTQYSISNEILKRKQLEIIQNSNPMLDDYHVGIRSVDDIKTFEEAMQDDESFVWGDFSLEDAQDALDQGEVMVYSSKPMNQGDFVSTSYNQARDYSGGGKVYSKVMKLSDIAWINGDEGQIAQVTNDIDSNRYAINSNILERAKDPSVRARAQMEKRIRHTFLFNNKSNPLKMYDVTSRIEEEFERTGKISEDLRKELFATAYEETLRSSDVPYKELPEFKQMLQEDLNRAVLQYENTLIKERELKKFAEENDIDASQIKFNPATGFLKNVKPEELPDKIISYKKLKASLKSDLIGQVNNYAGGKVIDELIDKAAIEIVEDGFISSPTKFKIRQEMIENGYSINADAMNDNKELYDFIKSTKLNVSRGFGREIQDYERTKKLLKTSTQDGQPIDKVYQELRSKFGEFFPDNLTNPADQYQQIYDVMAELEPTRLMLEDSEMYNAEMRQYLEDTFTDRLEDFKNQVLYRSQKDYYDRAAKKQVAYDEAMNEVSEKISEKFFKDNQEIDELKKSEHVIKGASIEDLSEIIAKIQDRGALSKTLAQNLDAMANGDVVLRAKLSEIFEKPLRQAKKTYVANQKRVLNDVYKRIVTDLGIKMGSKESAAMMWYGEGKKQLNKVKGKVESDKLEFTPYTLDDLKNEFPNTWQNIVAADKIMREYYDDYVDRINESLQKVYAESVLKESVNERRTQIQKDIREAQERLEQLKAQRTGEVGGPDLEARIEAQRKRIVDLSRQFNNVAEDVYRNKRLKKRSDYYHHFQEVGFAENIQQILNVDSANNIANALAGISEFTKPKSKWEKFMQRRSDVARYEEDAIKGFLKYAPAAEYKISFDPYVAQLRGTIQDMIKLSDEANMNNAKVINWLTNYTNSLAGKTNPMDRWLAHTESGRTVLQFLNKVNARVKANAVVGNLNSAVSQFYNLPNGTAVLTANGGAKAMADIAKGSKDYSAYVAKKMSGQDVSDNPINQSVFLQERFIDSTIDQFDERLIHKPAQAATFLLTFGDQVVAEQLWFSAYNQAQRLGKNDPIAYADDLVARAVGGRGIGEVPLMQQSQVVKLIAPFQVEVNNAYQLMKQLGSGALKDKDKLMALVVMYGITWIMNEINEALTGNRVGMDIYNAMQDAVDNWDAEKNPIANTFTAAGRLTGEILSNVPMGAQVAQMVVPDEYDREKLFGEADPSRYGTGNIGINAISDPLTQLATGQNIDWQSLVTNFGTPMGGKQLNRMYKMAEDAGLIPRVDINTSKGLQTSWKPGAYNDKGELKYQIDTSDPLNILKGFVFGTYATKEGKEYLDNEYKALSEKKTSLYEKAVKEGADSIEFYKALREANASKNLTDKNGKSISNSKAALNRQALEKNDSFDDVKKLVNSGAAEYTDFGLNKTVFEWTQEEFNRFLKSLNK